jgi:hypothetical protein
MAGSAYADYAPSKTDVVGVGSDTLQNIVGFLADGDAYGDTGYNQLGNKNKLVSFDATADANVRLAYGNAGLGPNCSPGTGGTAGTGNQTSTHTDNPCVQNPTIVLRAGLQAVQRPNGSGAGFKAFVQDIVAGHNTPGGPSATGEVISFSRASSAQSTTATLPSGENIDQLSIATDPLPIVESTTHAGTDTKTTDYPLSANQLSDIYGAASGSCLAWNTPVVSGMEILNAVFTSGSTTVTIPTTGSQPAAAQDGWVVEAVGSNHLATGSTTVIPSGDTVATTGTNSFTLTTPASTGGTITIGLVNPAASADTILPIIPQVGSGTRSYFLGQLSPALSNVGGCTFVSEENDPTAINAQTTPADAIAPVSQGRLDIFKGVTQNGTSGGIGGYFLDPSCAYLSGASTCGTGTVGTPLTWKTNAISVATVQTATGTPADGNTLFQPTRTLYIYVRSSDLTSTVKFQPTGTLNFVNEVFYNPAANGTTVPFPYIEQLEGQTLLQDAGVTPITVTCQDITTSTTC